LHSRDLFAHCEEDPSLRSLELLHDFIDGQIMAWRLIPTLPDANVSSVEIDILRILRELLRELQKPFQLEQRVIREAVVENEAMLVELPREQDRINI
jgi:hypothetical protein